VGVGKSVVAFGCVGFSGLGVIEQASEFFVWIGLHGDHQPDDDAIQECPCMDKSAVGLVHVCFYSQQAEFLVDRGKGGPYGDEVPVLAM
jgi:hypothetical protein